MKTLKYISILTLSILFLAACAGPIQQAGNLLGKANDHYRNVIKVETDTSGQFNAMYFEADQAASAIITGNQLSNQCFTNTQEVVVNAMLGRYANKDGTLDGDGFINALAINESFVGDVTVCQEMKAQLARDVTARSVNFSANNRKLQDMRSSLTQLYTGDLAMSIGIPLLRQAAQEFETANGNKYLVSDLVFPTFHLTSQTFSREICDFYNGQYNGKQVTGKCEWKPALNYGELSGQAAWDYIFMPRLSQAGRNTLDNGSNEPLDLGNPTPAP